MQAIQRFAATALRVVVPSLNPPYPLNQIDGLSVWYEARLLEEGIEDMQSLATANFVDVILHTRVPWAGSWTGSTRLICTCTSTASRARGVNARAREVRRARPQNLATASLGRAPYWPPPPPPRSPKAR